MSGIDSGQDMGRQRGKGWRRLVALATMTMLLAACGSEASEPDDGSSPGSGSTEASAQLGESVHINSSGGVVTEVWEETWFPSFEEETGVSITTSSPADLSVLKAQVESGNVEYDIAEIESGGQYLQAKEEGLLQEIDRDKLMSYFESYGGDPANIAEGAAESHRLWLTPYATILVFDEREFPEGGPQPDSLDDLWNVEEFPGPRCIQETALFNLEIALRADGVTQDDVYPIDVERAIEKLDELRPDIATFWRAGAEPVQLVADGECVMSTVWNGRPFGAEQEEGIDFFGVAFDGGILDTSSWVIPRGAPNSEEAHAALAYWMLPEPEAALANATGYAGANVAIEDLLDESVKPYIATTPENLSVLTQRDDQWWLDHGEAAEERFSEWRLSG